MATVSIEYYGMDGIGRNVTEAKKDAGHKISQALSDTYTPLMLRHKTGLAFVWREPRVGWTYRAIFDQSKDEEFLYGSSLGEGTRREAIRHARYHLAQVLWEPGNDEPSLDFLFEEDRAELGRWIAWQRRYAQLRADGLSDEEARDAA